MLRTLAAIALMVGGVSSTMVLTESDRLAAEEVHPPLVEVHRAESEAFAPSTGTVRR